MKNTTKQMIRKYFMVCVLISLIFAAFGQVSYNTQRQLIYVRTSTTHLAKPPASQLADNIWGLNTTDSVLYKLVDGVVVPAEHYYRYSTGKKNVVTDVTNAVTASYSTTKKMYYYLENNIAGNMPVSADFPTSIYRCVNTHDSLEYDKYSGVIRKYAIRYPYNPYKQAPAELYDIYVSVLGNDTIGDGSISKPYRSPYKASVVAQPWDKILIKDGKYIEKHKCNFLTGVSITGESKENTIIICTYNPGTTSYGVLPASFNFESNLAGTNGNQYISNLTIDGYGTTGRRAITVKNRGNVIVHDCIIKDFYAGGVSFYSQNGVNDGMGYDAIPSVYEDGNQIYNCTIDNCGDQDATADGGGLIMIACQKNMLIHDNLLYSNKRVGVHNGNIINAGGRHFKNVKYYNNKSYKPDPYGYEGWNFHLEIWNSDGGFEIYNNEFWGGDVAIDCAGHDSRLSGYDFCYSIHDNLFRQNDESITLYAGTPIELEAYYIVKTLIYNNTFRKGWNSIALWGWNMRDIFIYNNTFYQVRNAIWARYVSQGGTPIGELYLKNLWIYNNAMYCAPYAYTLEGNIQLNASNGWDIHDVFIYNNTAVGDNLVNTYAIKLSTTAGNKIGNVDIANNINCYFNRTSTYSIQNAGSIDTLKIRNNFAYNTSNRNTIPSFTGNTVTNYTYINNLPTSNTTQVSPLFVNESTQDYNLQNSSPCKGTGINLGYGLNIGAY